MAIRLAGRRAVMVKIESVYNTDSVPTGAANAMYAEDVTLTPLELVKHERNPARPFLGPDSPIVGGSPVKLDFSVPLSGSGAAGTAAAWGVLLRMAAHSETVTPATKVEYKPVSSGFESGSMYINEDGVLHAVTGTRILSISYEFNEAQRPMMKVSCVGNYVAPADVALPSPLTLTGWVKGLIYNKVNTPTITLHGTAVRAPKLTLNLAHTGGWKDFPNASEEVKITGRTLRGQLTIEADTIATKNWFSIAKAGTTGAFQMVHGTVAGNIVQVDAPVVQIEGISQGDNDGVRTYDFDLGFYPSAGNDEMTLTAK